MRLLRPGLLMALCLGAGLLPAAEGRPAGEYDACLARAGSTRATLACMEAELARRDARLNRNYKRAMARIQPFRRGDLRDVQRAWLRYRDRKCRFFHHRESGSGGLQDMQDCLLEETARRAGELADLY